MPRRARLEDKEFRRVFDAAADALVVVDSQGCVVAVNAAAERLVGSPQDELVSQSVEQLIPSGLHTRRPGRRWAASRGGDPVRVFIRERQGGLIPVEMIATPIEAGGGGLSLLTVRDLSKQWLVERRRAAESAQALATLESLGDAVIRTNASGTVMYLNPEAERLSGWSHAEAVGRPLEAVLPLVSDVTREPIESPTVRCLREGRTIDLAEGVLLRRRDGTEVTIGDSAAPMYDRTGAATGVVVVFHDVTEKRRTDQQLSYEATHDLLTGLVNRAELERQLARLLAHAAQDGTEHALCYLDVDRLKTVNDSVGHEAGDEALRQIVTVLSGCLRKRDVLARLGGDEFGALLEDCPLAEAERIAEQIREGVAEYRFTWEGQSFGLGLSVGVVPVTAASGLVADVLHAADSACYVAKSGGGNQIHLERSLDPGAPAVRRTPVRLLARLMEAVERGEFQLHAQRIVPLVPETAPRPRCEVLLRLPNEDGELLPAGAFLPQAQRHGLTPLIDRWVVRQTIGLLGTWCLDHPDCEPPVCSINLSAASLGDESLVQDIGEQLVEHKLPADALCFEITEAAALGNLPGTVRLVSGLRAVGCRIAVQEFGYGLASFGHLKALPVDFIKIPGQLTRAVADDELYGTLVTAVGRVGQIMGISTIAEHVEAETTLDRLRALGIAYAQGYAVARPEPLVTPDGEVAMPCFERSA